MFSDQHSGNEAAKSGDRDLESITILGVPIHNLTYDEALARIGAMIATGRPHQVVTVNPEFLVIARSNPAFHRVLAAADLALADGVGLQLAAALQGRRFISRVPGSALVYRLAPVAAAQGWRLFFLGAGPGVATRAASVLRTRYPNLEIEVDGADPTPEGTAAALAHIREVRPDILLVAYGAPTQDLWIARHRTTAGVPVMMGVGGTLDFVAGIVPRPPQLWQDLGLEWLYRLWQQPWRWRRQLRLPLFVLLVLAERLRHPPGRPPSGPEAGPEPEDGPFDPPAGSRCDAPRKVHRTCSTPSPASSTPSARFDDLCPGCKLRLSNCWQLNHRRRCA